MGQCYDVKLKLKFRDEKKRRVTDNKSNAKIYNDTRWKRSEVQPR